MVVIVVIVLPPFLHSLLTKGKFRVWGLGVDGFDEDAGGTVVWGWSLKLAHWTQTSAKVFWLARC